MTKLPDGIHALLKRQLKRNGLTDLSMPNELNDSWEEFLLSISRTYSNLEEDLYLLERSMTLSSNEMKTLTDKLEAIQKFARLGSWQLFAKDKALTFSTEAYELTGFNPLNGAPTWQSFLSKVHEDDISQLEEKIEESFKSGEEFSCEIKFSNEITDDYIWLYLKARIEMIQISEEKLTAMSGIMFDITARKQNEENLIKANQKMLSMARQPGMAEVATYILHNIGNILNSANVSMNIVKENIELPYQQKLFKVLSMLEEGCGDLNFFLLEDSKGKLIPEFLVQLNGRLQSQQKELINEVDNISQSLMHINDIVAMQKTVSGTSGAIEKVNVSKLIDYAIHMTNKSIKGLMPIKIDKHFEEVPLMYLNKSKVLQVLINLIKNAKDAVSENTECRAGKIEIYLKNLGENIKIQVVDNGIGIAPEHTKKMFTFGFTTKKHGHGFGLHGSALLAKEVGGFLEASSEGKGLGATFTLSLKVITEM